MHRHRGTVEPNTKKAEVLTDRLRAISDNAAGLWRPDLREADHDDLLYDEHGCPR